MESTWWRMPALAVACLLAGALIPARAQVPGADPARAPAASPAGGSADVEADIANCLEVRRSAPARAIALADRLLASARLAPADEIKVQSCLGMAASYTGATERALQAVTRAEALLAAHPMPSEFALRAVSNAGAILHGVGHIDAALDAYRRAYALAESGDEPRAQLVTLVNIGMIHSEELRAYEAAEGFYRKARALAAANDMEDPSLPYNQAQNLLRMGRRTQAATLFADAQATATRAGTALLARRAESQLLALQANADNRGALRGRLAALASVQLALPDVGGAAVTLTTLSQLALADGDPTAALAHAERAAQLSRSTAFRHEHIQALEAQLAALRALGRFDTALAVATELRDFETSLMRAQSMRALADLQARLEDGERTREIDRLVIADQARVVVLQRSQLLRNLALAGIVLLGVGTLAFAAFQRRIRRRLEQLSMVDPLTGLLNRRAASLRLVDGVFARLGDAGNPVRRSTLFLVDIDHFKDVNDRHGHAVGDAVLVEVARRLLAGCRPGDLVSRWGGEEFLVACPLLDLDGAIAIATRLRESVATGAIDVEGGPIEAPRVSVGFACWPFFPSAPQPGGAPRRWQDAVVVADRALYAVKRGGRNGWVGLWGSATSRQTVESFLHDPARSIAGGEVTLVPADLSVDWPTSGPAAASRGDAGAVRGTAFEGSPPT
ncbi:MAG TPA: GGDEF domain-containing protein [Luteimonas sp.]|nr:GGDEF domain-containing protein [Luteimonas sp.]